MATVEKRRQIEYYRVRCKGLTSDELASLYQGLVGQFPGQRLAYRNPFLPHFDSRTIHEIVMQATQTGLLAYAGKKAIDKSIDLIADVVKRRLSSTNSPRLKTITIYGPDERPALTIELKPKKPR
jgi:hypothetical protein